METKIVAQEKDIFYLINKYSGIVSRIETEMLLEYLFNCTKLDLYVRDFVVNETVEGLYDSLINRRLGGEPVQYITGQAEFMGLDFIVTKDTFIPRPETELLVNEVINSSRLVRLRRDSLEHYWNGRVSSTQYSSSGHDSISGEQSREVKILDLCTGSGNIAISLARLIPQAEITATDVSDAALKIAEKNAARHDAGGRIKFYRGNLFNALIFDTFGGNSQDKGRLSINTGIKQDCVVKNPKFDIIVCNPPYIKHGDFPFLQDEVKREPEISLNGGRDGLDFYRIIAKGSRRYLKKGGGILLEIGFGQRQAVEDIFCSYNIFKTYRVINDFSGIARALWINLL